jgi:hypothetical protein
VDIVYNNVIHDNTPVGVTIYECDGSTIYNNVLWNNDNKQILISACSGQGSSAVMHVYGNTVYCPGGSCFGSDSKGTLPGTVNLKNNHWITNGTPISNASAIATWNQSNNLTMSTATATSQGYTIANKYAPTALTNGTVSTAVSLSGLCSGALSSLCTDVLHFPRLTSWDAGAYQFGSASTKPAAPSSLSATVQ